MHVCLQVGPRRKADREEDVGPGSSNLLLMVAGAGVLWMGWTGFNGGDPFSANTDSSVAVLNTHISATTSILAWVCCDVAAAGKPSVVGAVKDMVTGLVYITPAAGLVQGWAAMAMGVASGTVPWYTMNMCRRRRLLSQQEEEGEVDDTPGILHTHAVSGLLGGVLTAVFAHPALCNLFLLPVTNSRGLVYGVRVLEARRSSSSWWPRASWLDGTWSSHRPSCSL